MPKNTDQKNSEYEPFLHSAFHDVMTTDGEIFKWSAVLSLEFLN